MCRGGSVCLPGSYEEGQMQTKSLGGCRRRRWAQWLGAFAVVLASLSLGAYGQETGQIAGTVVDSTGAAIPNVTINARNVGTNSLRTATSNAAGGYLFTGLA